MGDGGAAGSVSTQARRMRSTTRRLSALNPFAQPAHMVRAQGILIHVAMCSGWPVVGSGVFRKERTTGRFSKLPVAFAEKFLDGEPAREVLPETPPRTKNTFACGTGVIHLVALSHGPSAGDGNDSRSVNFSDRA